jgi:putative endonuclease
MKTNHQDVVYLLASKIRGTLYIGITNDLQRRVYEHKKAMIQGFTKKYRVHKLVYFESFQNINEAIKREKNLKKWKRSWKIKLIEKTNKKWEDLAFNWFDDILTT